MYWLSIKDKLPEPYIFVLVYSQMPGTNEPCPITIARWNGEKWETLCNEEENNACAKGNLFWATDSSEITHWMPLPESPNGEWNGFGKDVRANIKLAKERREKGEGAWQKMNEENAEVNIEKLYLISAVCFEAMLMSAASQAACVTSETDFSDPNSVELGVERIKNETLGLVKKFVKAGNRTGFYISNLEVEKIINER